MPKIPAPTPEQRDERLSLDPLTFEEAVRGLLAVDPTSYPAPETNESPAK